MLNTDPWSAAGVLTVLTAHHLSKVEAVSLSAWDGGQLASCPVAFPSKLWPGVVTPCSGLAGRRPAWRPHSVPVSIPRMALWYLPHWEKLPRSSPLTWRTSRGLPSLSCPQCCWRGTGKESIAKPPHQGPPGMGRAEVPVVSSPAGSASTRSGSGLPSLHAALHAMDTAQETPAWVVWRQRLGQPLCSLRVFGSEFVKMN